MSTSSKAYIMSDNFKARPSMKLVRGYQGQHLNLCGEYLNKYKSRNTMTPLVFKRVMVDDSIKLIAPTSQRLQKFNAAVEVVINYQLDRSSSETLILPASQRSCHTPLSSLNQNLPSKVLHENPKIIPSLLISS